MGIIGGSALLIVAAATIGGGGRTSDDVASEVLRVSGAPVVPAGHRPVPPSGGVVTSQVPSAPVVVVTADDDPGTPTPSSAVPSDVAYRDVAVWDVAPPPRSSDGRRSVLYLGDSMATLTVGALAAALPDWDVIDATFGGSAPCDWLDHPTYDAGLAAEPDLVVFSFIGNSITPCTGGAVGPSLLAAYERDLLALCAAAVPARCVAVGQPVLDPGIARTLPGPDEPNGMFLAHAYAGDWGFVDAGHDAEDDGGGFDLGRRHPDGVHYNEAGAERAAAAIAAYLLAAV
jgi:hypothetical protein